MPPDSWAEFQRRFGVSRVLETYAASEANTGFFNAFGQVGSVGFCPSSYALLRWDADAEDIVRDGRGRPIRARRGEVGLLVGKVTPRFDFDGYADAEASERKLRRDLFRRGDAWVDTGDLLLNQGWRHAAFVDRLGDTFRWKSENVSTQQVEAALRSVPGVEACVVYGVRVPGHAGRAGMAAIVGDPDPASLLATLRERLPEPAIPVFLRLVDAIPTTPTHKPRKGPLQGDGFEPDGVQVRVDGAFVPLDAELRRRLDAQDLRLG
jgi:acyl-CoA synthetase (AMP-forming)/AMP-acid ligase II